MPTVSFTSFLQCYVASKVHCVWLINGELRVLFECEGPSQLEATPIHLVRNKELVKDYLEQKKHIPHIRKTVTMQSTEGLQVTDQQ